MEFLRHMIPASLAHVDLLTRAALRGVAEHAITSRAHDRRITYLHGQIDVLRAQIAALRNHIEELSYDRKCTGTGDDE